jgi:NAD(P)H-quinone oxidoreductase subunit M
VYFIHYPQVVGFDRVLHPDWGGIDYNPLHRLFSDLPATMLLKSTTRHIHIYTAEVQNNELVPSDQVLTLDVDPDNELTWDDDALQKVYRYFDDLVEEYAGRELIEYNLRKIGSDLEHFVRTLLQKGEIGYNLNSRVLNYSMGLPQVADPAAK